MVNEDEEKIHHFRLFQLKENIILLTRACNMPVSLLYWKIFSVAVF